MMLQPLLENGLCAAIYRSIDDVFVGIEILNFAIGQISNLVRIHELEISIHASLHEFKSMDCAAEHFNLKDKPISTTAPSNR